MFWHRNKGGGRQDQPAARPVEEAGTRGEATLPRRPPRMPEGFVYGHFGDAPLRRTPNMFTADVTREIFSGVPPEKLERFGAERLSRIAYTSYVMAEEQVHNGSPMGAMGVDALTRWFAVRHLDQAYDRMLKGT